MSRMYLNLKRLMSVAENVGEVTTVEMFDFLDKYDRITLRGMTGDGKRFELNLEVEKEVQQDA